MGISSGSQRSDFRQAACRGARWLNCAGASLPALGWLGGRQRRARQGPDRDQTDPGRPARCLCSSSKGRCSCSSVGHFLRAGSVRGGPSRLSKTSLTSPLLLTSVLSFNWSWRQKKCLSCPKSTSTLSHLSDKHCCFSQSDL